MQSVVTSCNPPPCSGHTTAVWTVCPACRPPACRTETPAPTTPCSTTTRSHPSPPTAGAVEWPHSQPPPSTPTWGPTAHHSLRLRLLQPLAPGPQVSPPLPSLPPDMTSDLTVFSSGLLGSGMSMPLQVPGQSSDIASNYWPRLQ